MGFAGQHNLTSEHAIYQPPIFCTRISFATLLEAKCLVGCDPSRGWWDHPDPVVISRVGLKLSDLVVVHPESASQARVTLTDSSIGFAGRDALVTTMARATRGLARLEGLAGASVAPAAAIADPDLLVALGAETHTDLIWLTPVAAGDGAVQYDVLAQDTIPVALADGSRLLSDAGAGTAALFVPEQGIWGYDAARGGWTNVGAPREVVLRHAPALLMVGSALMVASGWYESPLTDLWAVNVEGLGAEHVGDGLPSRQGALLAADSRSSTLIMAGGYDSTGVGRDDVWELSRIAPDTISAVLKSSGSGTGAALTPETAVLDIEPISGAVNMWRADTASDGGIARFTASAGGWLALDHSGEPSAACPEASTHGGELCAISSAWWAIPGLRSCDSSSCEGAPGTLLATKILAGQPAVAAVAVPDAVWVLRRRRLERWGVGGPGVGTLLASVVLPSDGLLLAKGQGPTGGVLVGTADGVAAARWNGSMVSFGGWVPLCGRALAATSVADDSWFVATTLGVAVVGTPPTESPTVQASGIVGFGPVGRTSFHPATWGPPALAACRLLDRLVGPRTFQVMQRATAATNEGVGRVLLAAPLALFELDVSNTTRPLGLRSLVPERPLDTLRADSIQGRLYGSGDFGSVIVDLRGDDLDRRGPHDIPDWVRRTDAPLPDGAMLVAHVLGGAAEVAWVGR